MRLRSKPALALVAVVATSCLPGGRLPEMAVKRGGSLDTAGRVPTSDRGPFRVSFAGPEGADIEHPQPQVVFSRPVRALGQARDEPKIDARFSPAIAGRWEWVGTSAARFVPDSPFDRATTYTLEIAPGIRALDGEALSQPVKLTFSTLRPTLVSIYPNAGDHEVSPTEIVRMQFSQIIPRSALEHGTRVVDRSGHDVPFVLEQDGDRWSHSVQLKPKGRWPEGERLTIKLASGIHGTEGVLPMVPRDVTFDTLSHLHVVRIECYTVADGRCRNGAAVGVALSGDMRPSDFRRLLSIKPAVKLKPPSPPDDVSTSYHVLEGDFREGVPYVVNVDAAKAQPRQPPPRKQGEAAEVLRQLKLGGRAALTFAPTPPSVELSFSGTYLPPSSTAEIAAKAEDTKKAMAGAVPLTREKVLELAGRAEKRPWWEWAGAKTAVLPARATKKDPPGWLSLLPQSPSGPGPVVFGARWEGLGGAEEATTQVLQRSDLALHARVSPEGTLAWVTSLTTGLPIEGAKVEARDGAQHSVSAVTGKDGVALLSTAAVGTKPDKGDDDWRAPSAWMVLFVERGDDWIFQRVETPAKAPLRAALFTDRGLYRPGETAHLKGVVREPTSKGLVPVQGRDVSIEWVDTKGRNARGTVKLSTWGTFDYAVALPADAPLGTYTAKVLIDDVGVASENFQVKEYRPSTFSVESRLASATDPARKIHKRGDKLVCAGHARYLYGGSLEGATASAYLSRQHAKYQVPDLQGFTVEEAESKPTPGFSGAERKAKLDATGHAELPVALDNDGQWGPELVTCDVTVTDPSEELVAASSSVLVHPGDVYVALEDRRYQTLFPGQTLRPKVLAVTPEGKREARPVHLELVQFIRNPKSSWAALPGESVASCDVTTGADPQSCALVAPQASFDDTTSFIVRGSLVDPRGPVSASVRYFPGKPPKIEPPRAKKKEKPRPVAKIEADKPSYAAGTSRACWRRHRSTRARCCSRSNERASASTRCCLPRKSRCRSTCRSTRGPRRACTPP